MYQIHDGDGKAGARVLAKGQSIAMFKRLRMHLKTGGKQLDASALRCGPEVEKSMIAHHVYRNTVTMGQEAIV